MESKSELCGVSATAHRSVSRRGHSRRRIGRRSGQHALRRVRFPARPDCGCILPRPSQKPRSAAASESLRGIPGILDLVQKKSRVPFDFPRPITTRTISVRNLERRLERLEVTEILRSCTIVP